MEPLTREEQYLNRLTGEYEQTLPEEPITRKEQYLSRLCGSDNIIPQEPLTREEQFLANLCGEEVETPEPLTRIEQYMAFAGGESETKPASPLTRQEKYWDEYQGGAVPEEKTVTGNPISVSDALAQDALSLQVAFAPTQDGTPSIDSEPTTEPYLSKLIPRGNKEYYSLVGATVAWNQLVQITDFVSVTYGGITGTNNGDGTYTVNGRANDLFDVYRNYEIIANHVYFVMGCPSGGSPYTYRLALASESDKGSGLIYKSEYGGNTTLAIRISNGTEVNNLVFRPQLFDLTLMFGTTIANYAYSLEQAQAGSGIAWLKSYGFFTKDYYPYNPGELISVKTSAHKIGSTSYPLGNDELRGLFKLQNGKIYADGDVKTSDGQIERNFEYRAYQSGDESIADAITDGTHTVVKLATPTTESADPFTSPVDVEAGGTEEFIDERTVPIPVGNETYYASEYEVQGKTGVSVTRAGKNLLNKDAPMTTGKYLNSSGQEVLSGSYSVTDFIPVKPNTTYFWAINGVPSAGLPMHIAPRVGFYDADKNWVVSGNVLGLNGSSYTTPSNVRYARLSVYYLHLNSEMFVEGEVIPTEYSPYQGTTYNAVFTQQGTVYGGTVDIVSGVLSVTWAILSNPQNLNWISNSSQGMKNFQTASGTVSKKNGSNNWKCSRYSNGFIGTDKSEGIFIFDSGEVCIRDYRYWEHGGTSAEEAAFKTSLADVTIAYELATPQTYNLTPEQVTMLLGNNYLSTEDGIITITYMAKAAERVRAMNANLRANIMKLNALKNTGGESK